MQPVQPPRGQPSAGDERIAIRTPEHVELNFLLAGAGNRFLALALDLVLQWLFLLGLMLALWLVGYLSHWTLAGMSRSLRSAAGLWLLAAVILVVFLVNWGYFTFFETVWAGQTPGKRRQGIRVIRENGRPIGFSEAAIRNLLRAALDSQPYPWHAIGFVTGMPNARFKRLGDFAAGTVVIVERRQAVPRSGPRLRPTSPAAEGERRLRLRQLTPEETATLHAYLRRRETLAPEVRAAVAQKIAKALLERLAIAQPPDMGSDAFLVWLGEEVRKSQSFS